MATKNVNLTDSNESEVLALVQNCKIKGEWQALADLRGRILADAVICDRHNLTVRVIKAARFYW